MALEEFGKSLKAALYDRAKSPFYGTFIISWLVWNWKLVYYIIADGDNKIEFKIEYITDYYINAYTNFWNPLWSALVVFIVGSCLTIGFRYLQIAFSDFRKRHIEQLEMLSKEETVAAKKELVEYENRINSSSIDLKRQIENFENQIKNKELEVGEWEKKHRLQGEELDNLKNTLNEPTRVEETLESLNDNIIYDDIKDINAESENFETADSEILQNTEGSILVWAEVTDEHNGSTEKAYKYILSHASNKGSAFTKTPLSYANAWSISIFTSGSRKRGEWRFWATNSKGEGSDNILKSTKLLENGWHLFGVTWSKSKNFIRFYIDKRKEGEQEFKFWPDEIRDGFYIGTWPSENKVHYFNSKIGVIYALQKPLSISEISKIYNSAPYRNNDEILSGNLQLDSWEAKADKNKPQWLNYNEVDLRGAKIKNIACNLLAHTNYIRFGFKLMKRTSQVYNDDGILTDGSFFIHIGKEKNDSKIYVTYYHGMLKGISTLAAGEFKQGKEINLVLEIEEETKMRFFVNRIMIYEAIINPELRDRLALMAWGDGNEFRLTAKDITLNTQ
jgi:hypothetical protein